jgi:hypothetical protein
LCTPPASYLELPITNTESLAYPFHCPTRVEKEGIDTRKMTSWKKNKNPQYEKKKKIEDFFHIACWDGSPLRVGVSG